MQTLIWILILIASLAVAAAASQVFAAKAEEAAKASRFSPFFTGVMVMALGVSLPELVTSVVASLKNYSSFVPALVWGSNLVNLLLILGVSAMRAKTLTISKEDSLKQIPLLLCTVFLLIALSFDGTVTSTEGLILLAALVVFLLAKAQAAKQGLLDRMGQLFNMESWSIPLALALLLSAVALVAGSYFSFVGTVELSEQNNWLPGLLGGSAVALAFSIPELALALRAAKKGYGDEVVSILVTSTVLNSTLVIAIASFMGPLNVSGETLVLALPFLLISLILFSFSALQKRWSAYEGAFLVLLYLVFLFQFLNPLLS
jgi:cation:H+ antiporter